VYTTIRKHYPISQNSTHLFKTFAKQNKNRLNTLENFTQRLQYYTRLFKPFSKTLHNCTTHKDLKQHIQTFTSFYKKKKTSHKTFYTTIQNKKLYKMLQTCLFKKDLKALQNFTKHYTTVRNSTQIYTTFARTLQKLYKTSHNYTNIYSQNFTVLYTTLHNFTRLCNTLQYCTILFQNYTKL